MTGVGGGSLMTPLLTLLFGVRLRWPSAPTSPSPRSPRPPAPSPTACAAPCAGISSPPVHGRAAGRLARHPGAQAFRRARCRIGQIIRYSIAGSVLLTVVALLFRARCWPGSTPSPSRQLQGRALAAATIVSGAVLGTLVTVSSIGAGAIGATLLVMLYPKTEPGRSGRHRHRLRRAADRDRRLRPLVAGLDQLDCCWPPAHRFGARHHARFHGRRAPCRNVSCAPCLRMTLTGVAAKLILTRSKLTSNTLIANSSMQMKIASFAL
jgi:hypothetical protein